MIDREILEAQLADLQQRREENQGQIQRKKKELDTILTQRAEAEAEKTMDRVRRAVGLR